VGGGRAGAVSPPCVAVEGVERAAVGVDLLLVRTGEALDVGAVDRHRRRSLELRRQAGLDEQRRELVQADLLEGATFGQGRTSPVSGSTSRSWS
jgi:hypothetical protein